MKSLVWGSSFVRVFKKTVRRQPELWSRIEQALRQLAADPFAPGPHTHKLKGRLAGTWACTAGYDCRIVFEFVLNPESGEEEILLIDVGTHDEVH